MEKKYTLPEIEIVLIEEDVVRTSDPLYGGDSSDNWGLDIWE